MAVYVDELRWALPPASASPQVKRISRRTGSRWCHMFSDTPAELHDMAQRIGLRRAYFQDRPGFPHYDLTPSRRERALQAGAAPLPLREWIRRQRLVVRS